MFKTYPSPLTHLDCILATMERNVLYRAIANDKGEIVSAASAEVDEKHSNAELTDCATNPSERGRSLHEGMAPSCRARRRASLSSTRT